ncbi:MAG: hypothetical protein ACM3ZF_09915 [Mycobacterium leprae]
MPRRSAPLVTHRTLARGIALLRVAVGTALLTRPELLPRLLGVDRVTARRLRWAGQMLGGRDLGLGAGALATDVAARRRWLLTQVAVDAVDGAALFAALRRRAVLPLPAAVFGAAGVATAAVELRLALTAPPDAVPGGATPAGTVVPDITSLIG